ncbi:MAG TPA: hypothetical protein VF649_06485 [Sphingomonas sp.]|jgi:cytochrome c551/c552|uniref:hypothetical protein n=1 Tax=Sphingomonas sp. TaxID=28214 RepID=UPI002ED94A81
MASALLVRQTSTSRDVIGGCFVCHGAAANWFGPQAQGTAARHHDATGHATWAEVVMTVRYGRNDSDGLQLDIETAIAARSP